MKPWTEAELAALRTLYPRPDRLAIVRALPGRRWPTICRKAHDLGLKRPGTYNPVTGRRLYGGRP